jgi:hypothetical protein
MGHFPLLAHHYTYRAAKECRLLGEERKLELMMGPTDLPNAGFRSF